jgi:hypothetical protein
VHVCLCVEYVCLCYVCVYLPIGYPILAKIARNLHTYSKKHQSVRFLFLFPYILVLIKKVVLAGTNDFGFTCFISRVPFVSLIGRNSSGEKAENLEFMTKIGRIYHFRNAHLHSCLT